MFDLIIFCQFYFECILGVVDGDVFEVVWLVVFGKKGEISGMMKELGCMLFEECQICGVELNWLCDEVDIVLWVCKQGMEDVVFDVWLKDEWLDVILLGCLCL